MPLGFTAFAPEWLLLGRLAPPRHSGPWVGAPVASLRCRTLRPGEISINQGAARKHSYRKLLPELLPARYNNFMFWVRSVGRF